MRIVVLLALAAAFLLPPSSAVARLPDPAEVPPGVPAERREALSKRRAELIGVRASIEREVREQNAECGAVVEEDAAKTARCLDWAARIKAKAAGYRAAIAEFGKEAARPVASSQAPSREDEETRVIRGILELAAREGWGTEEIGRLDNTLHALRNLWPGDKAHDTWKKVLARGNDETLAREARKAGGFDLPGAGQQTSHDDCALFALATAAGRPYGFVAARAAELIGKGKWRDAEERRDPQKKVFDRGGLIGGELILLAEEFGFAEVVERVDFAKALSEGRPLMVAVAPSGQYGPRHEVVLTKAFRHGGEEWFEMVESYRGPASRLYLTGKELDAILRENGVSYRPDPERIPCPLRQ